MSEYLVVNTYNPQNDYGIKIRKQYCRILSSLELGQKVIPQEFIQDNLDRFTRKKSFSTNREAIYHALTVGKKIGILKQLSAEEKGLSISYEEFCRQDTVKYFIDQLRRPKYKNLDLGKWSGTAFTYSNHLWKFNNWLYDKEFEFVSEIPTGHDTFQRKRIEVKLKGVQHFRELYLKSYNSKPDFVRIIKRFLLDPCHKDNTANYMKIKYNAIKSYFEKNDSF